MVVHGEIVTDQLCRKCHARKPLTASNFHADAQEPSGFRAICRTCRQEEDDTQANEEVAERLRQLRNTGLNVMDLMSSSGTEVPHQAEVYQRFMELCGGAPGVAKQIYLHCVETRPGSMQMQKCIDAMLRLSKSVSESGAAQKSLDMLSDDELMKEAQEAARQLLPFHEEADVTDEPMEERDCG